MFTFRFLYSLISTRDFYFYRRADQGFYLCSCHVLVVLGLVLFFMFLGALIHAFYLRSASSDHSVFDSDSLVFSSLATPFLTLIVIQAFVFTAFPGSFLYGFLYRAFFHIRPSSSLSFFFAIPFEAASSFLVIKYIPRFLK